MLEIVNQLDGFDSRGNIKVRPARTATAIRHIASNPVVAVPGTDKQEIRSNRNDSLC